MQDSSNSPPANPLARLKARLQRRAPPGEAAKTRARRRKALLLKAGVAVPYVQLALAVAGILQFLAVPLPLSQLAKRAYIDENAFQPGQVNTYFTWSDVARADRYADALQPYVGLNRSQQRAEHIVQALQELGLPAAIQEYTSQGADLHYNAYARLRAPKTSGSEVLVMNAPWLSRQQGMKNVRGTAILLSLAKQLQRLSMWSKDIILVFSDGELDGLQAWLRAYHGIDSPNVEKLTLAGGSVWGAVSVDYPYHSFSSIGIFYDGVNGRLPNLDLVNGVTHIVKWIGGVPLTLHRQPYDEYATAGGPLNPVHYMQRARGLLQQVSYAASTLPSGAEGLFAEFGIDAIGLFAEPAEGPHGFHTMGKILESILRAFNNLTERLHASFFLYLLPEPHQFLSVASYLSAPILIGAALTIGGLRLWRRATSSAGLGLWLPLSVSYAVGVILLLVDQKLVSTSWIAVLLAMAMSMSAYWKPNTGTGLLSITCLITGMFISVLTILNYGLGSVTALSCGVPALAMVYSTSHTSGRQGKAVVVQGVLLATASAVAIQCASVRAQAHAVGGIAPLVLHLAVIPLWIQLCLAS